MDPTPSPLAAVPMQSNHARRYQRVSQICSQTKHPIRRRVGMRLRHPRTSSHFVSTRDVLNRLLQKHMGAYRRLAYRSKLSIQIATPRMLHAIRRRSVRARGLSPPSLRRSPPATLAAKRLFCRSENIIDKYSS